jgi:ATP-binding cassette subfamily G (WHITE) protein 1
VYQGSTKQLVPFLSTLDLECPSYHNPASYIIEVACGEHGDNNKKLVRAIDNGQRDIRTETDYQSLKMKMEKDNLPKVHASNEINLKSTYDKNEKFSKINSSKDKSLIHAKIVNDIVKGGDNVAINVDTDAKEPGTETALLGEETGDLSPERYPTSEFHQFWVVLKRTLLFSRRDWVSLILFIELDKIFTNFLSFLRH